jgi:uncharacterized membrane protein
MTPEIPYRRKAVDPVECIKRGWEIVKPNYLLFVGMCFIGYFIGTAVPLGILMGPMMAGMYLCLLAARRREEPVEFGMLFKGFDFFGPSLIATLLHMVPIMVIVIPTYLLFYIGVFFAVAVAGQSNSSAPVFGLFAAFSFVMMVIGILLVIISIGFTFAYPLIVDRKLAGWDAVKLSFKAAMANFWRLLGMMLLTGLLSIGGALCLIVGMFFVLPIVYGAVASAYEQVFGLADPRAFGQNLPPPPPVFNEE